MDLNLFYNSTADHFSSFSENLCSAETSGMLAVATTFAVFAGFVLSRLFKKKKAVAMKKKVAKQFEESSGLLSEDECGPEEVAKQQTLTVSSVIAGETGFSEQQVDSESEDDSDEQDKKNLLEKISSSKTLNESDKRIITTILDDVPELLSRLTEESKNHSDTEKIVSLLRSMMKNTCEDLQ